MVAQLPLEQRVHVRAVAGEPFEKVRLVMAGRIGSYIHSDNSTPCKGGCLAKLVCQTDFASKTPEFAAFANKIAMMAFGFQESNPDKLFEIVPALSDDQMALVALIKEKVWITDIVFQTITKDDTSRCDGSLVIVKDKKRRIEQKSENTSVDLLDYEEL